MQFFTNQNNNIFADAVSTITGQKGHYPPGNHHASHLQKVLFPGHNHLLTTGADGPSASEGDYYSEGSSAPVVSRWL